MKKLFIITAIAFSVAGLKAQDTEPFQASLAPNIAIYPRTTQIIGLSLNFWGENPQRGLDLGVINGSTGDSEGFTWAFIANYADSYTGVAWSLVNISRENFTGWQAGMVNYSEGAFTGLQSGWVNVAQRFHGLQAGFVNYSENLRGVQLGFVNVAMNNSWFNDLPDQFATGFPFVNWSF